MPESLTAAQVWNQIIHALPGSHLLQTWEWGYIKAQFGWRPHYAIWKNDHHILLISEDELPILQKKYSHLSSQGISAAALILQRSLPLGLPGKRKSILYIPKGPLLDWKDISLRQQVLNDLQGIANRLGSIFLKIDPDARLGSGIPGSTNEKVDPIGQTVVDLLRKCNWRFSQEQIQFRNTVMIDLTLTEEDLLSKMKQKSRYNLRLAERKGVIVRQGDHIDIPLLYQMYAETSLRDGFIIREENYYRTVLETFFVNSSIHSTSSPTTHPLIAYVNDEPVAALVVFIFAQKAWYLYGMSREAHREKMPNYLLQWEAIRLAKRCGCMSYDLWGAPDQLTESDPLWGVFKFKEGLGGEVVRHIGAWDYPVNPSLYTLYTKTLPRVLGIMRNRRKNQTQQSLG